MKRVSMSRARFCLGTVAGLMAVQAFATQGPYIGLQLGGNLAGSETFGFRGNHDLLPYPPPVPTTSPPIQNFGEAGRYKYDISPVGQIVLGYTSAYGFRPEFELSLRRDQPKSISYSDGTTGNKKGVQLSSTTGMFNLWYDFFPSRKIHPYVGAGAGFIREFLNNGQFDPPSGNQFTAPPSRKADDATAAFQGGAGVNWDVLKHFTVGLDYRYFRSLRADFYPYKDQPQTFVSGSYKAQSVLLSVHYHFGFPSTPAPAKPEPVVVVPVVTPPDSDGDGVPDASDQCPGTPAGVKVDVKGCPLPPPCKTPEPGEKISLAGCSTGDSIVLRGVNFDNDKASLTLNAKALLDDVVAELVKYPSVEVEIDGHTDSNGSHAHNQGLSQRRAASVKAYLVKNAIAASRITTAGFAETMPIADNATDEGRELNRRVELKIIKGTEPSDVSTETTDSGTAAPDSTATAAAADGSTTSAAPPTATEAPSSAPPADATAPVSP